MLPLILLIALLGGCQNPKVLDETQYVTGSPEEQFQRAKALVEKNDKPNALIQLNALGQTALSQEQSRWVRDEIVRIYEQERDYEKLIGYLDSRAHLKNVSSDERADDLFDKAEAYHRLSYNHWARVLGMGSPYRRAKTAMQAKKYYEEYLSRYPHSPKAEYVKAELQALDHYLERYNAELTAHKNYRRKTN